MKAIWRPLIIGTLLLPLFSAGSAGAVVSGFCMQPTAPMAFLRKPSRPFCAASGDCSDLDVQMYRNELERYARQLKNYAEEVDTYYEDAGRYIKCMADLD